MGPTTFKQRSLAVAISGLTGSRSVGSPQECGDDAAAKVGTPKLPGQTPKEHLARLAEIAPDKASELEEVVDYYYAVRYEGAKIDKGKERAFRAIVGRLA